MGCSSIVLPLSSGMLDWMWSSSKSVGRALMTTTTSEKGWAGEVVVALSTRERAARRCVAVMQMSVCLSVCLSIYLSIYL